ncbi:MAG: peptide deformylase [Pantoea sp. Brub]|nr:peptide deformylase [Pantoea sp. Brub]
MSVLQLLYFPDNRLRKKAELVKQIDFTIQNIIDDMLETMYYQEGIGLAATQVNIHQRIIVIDISNNHNEHLILINPELIYKKGQISIEEGCLSIPNQHAFIPRYESIKIRALNRNGNVFELEANNLLSICIQHELDHLDGKLFIDYLSPLKRQRIKTKLIKLAKKNIKYKK